MDIMFSLLGLLLLFFLTFLFIDVIYVMTSLPEKLNRTFLSSPRLNSASWMGRQFVMLS